MQWQLLLLSQQHLLPLLLLLLDCITHQNVQPVALVLQMSSHCIGCVMFVKSLRRLVPATSTPNAHQSLWSGAAAPSPSTAAQSHSTQHGTASQHGMATSTVHKDWTPAAAEPHPRCCQQHDSVLWSAAANGQCAVIYGYSTDAGLPNVNPMPIMLPSNQHHARVASVQALLTLLLPAHNRVKLRVYHSIAWHSCAAACKTHR
jgi:hypothetical protein